MILLNQLIRFAGIGFLNTAMDFAVLNLLASFFGAYVGWKIGLINLLSFTAAVLHSYIWNKSWVFGTGQAVERFWVNIFKGAGAGLLGLAVLGLVIWAARQASGSAFYLGVLLVLLVGEIILWKSYRLTLPSFLGTQTELGLFVVVSVVGILINSGIVAGGTAVFPPQFGLNQELWTNLVKAAATAISLVWNFVGYKLLVFRR